MVTTADSGGGGAAEGVEDDMEENEAYVSYSPPETAADDPQRAREGGD